MAEDQRPVLQPTFAYARTRLSRRKVVTILGVLVLVVIACIATIGLMLERLETRNANFHPPMTPAERESLMPSEPRLDVAPSVDGLRYRGEDSTVTIKGDTRHAQELSHAH